MAQAKKRDEYSKMKGTIKEMKDCVDNAGEEGCSEADRAKFIEKASKI